MFSFFIILKNLQWHISRLTHPLFLFLYILCSLLYRHPHLGTPPHHYLAVTPSGRGGNLNSYRVPLLLMAVSVQSQVSVILKGSLWFHSPPSPAPLKPLCHITWLTNLGIHPNSSEANISSTAESTELLHHFLLMWFDKISILFGGTSPGIQGWEGCLMSQFCHLLILLLCFSVP